MKIYGMNEGHSLHRYDLVAGMVKVMVVRMRMKMMMMMTL